MSKVNANLGSMTSPAVEPHRVEHWYLKHSILLGVFVALLGCGYSDGHVYKRFRSLECGSGVFNRSVPNSARCCDEGSSGGGGDDWVCTTAYDVLTGVMSSAWAWALPLAPLGIRALGGGLESLRRSDHIRRLGFYLALFLYRTVVLYRLLNFIEAVLQAQGEQTSHSCWYRELTLRCKEAFDFSDHVVLMLVHYCAPAALELGHAVRSLSEGSIISGTSSGISSGTGLRTASSSSASSELVPCLGAAAASLAVFASAFRAVFFTSIYFHTPAEIVVASLVVVLLFYLPAAQLLRRAPSLLGPHAAALQQ